MKFQICFQFLLPGFFGWFIRKKRCIEYFLWFSNWASHQFTLSSTLQGTHSKLSEGYYEAPFPGLEGKERPVSDFLKRLKGCPLSSPTYGPSFMETIPARHCKEGLAPSSRFPSYWGRDSNFFVCFETHLSWIRAHLSFLFAFQTPTPPTYLLSSRAS